MYCHHLTAQKGPTQVTVPCEDLPRGKLIGVWPYDLELSEATYLDLLNALRDWVTDAGFEYRLYITKSEFETNQPETEHRPTNSSTHTIEPAAGGPN